jgi:hypothetical protein
MKENTPLSPYEAARCTLRLQGRVTADWSDWLEECEVVFGGEGAQGSTVLNGIVRDQAALFGLLSFVRDLGAVLLGVEIK